MQVAADTGALVMVHAENGDAIDVLVQAGARGGEHRAEVPRAHPAARDRGRGDEPGDPARARRRRAALRRPRLLQGRDRPDRASRARRAGTSGARPAPSTSSSTTRSSTSPASRARSTSTRRRRGEGEPGALWDGGRDGRPLGRLDRPLRLPTSTARRRSARTTSRRSRTAGPASRTGCR